MTRIARLAIALFLLPTFAFAQVTETITVERILIDARVTDYQGDPILGLEASDFTVKLAGKPAKVESALWVPESAAQRAIAGLEEEQRPQVLGDEVAPDGRLLVFFIQTDFGRNGARVSGQMKFLPHVETMLEALEPEDRVAVFSFDSHLKFRLDFSSDKDAIMDAVRGALMIDEPEWPKLVANPSLSRRLVKEDMKKAASSEAAMIVVGNALRPIPGPKTMVLMGWGLGVMAGGMMWMTDKYAIARYVLEASRVTIFALDTTNVDYHSLEAGLKVAAADTGGFYAKTHQFPQVAIERFKRTIAGHYELEVRRPDGLPRGTHTIEVNVKKRGTYVLARGSWMDR